MDIIAKKKFGQNFLVNQEAKLRLEKILQNFLQKSEASQILEIGPGLGDLTAISSKYLPVTAVEIDPEMVQQAGQTITETYKARLYLGDYYQWQKEIIAGNLALNATESRKTQQHEQSAPVPKDFVEYVSSANLSIVSNLPYNLGSRILVDLAVLKPEASFLVLLQEEVVDKLTHLDTNFTLLGAWLNIFWNFKKEMIFPRHFFMPQPKIVSALVSSYPRALPEFLQSTAGREMALNLLKNLFGLPSKTILNNLRNIDWEADKIDKLLKTLNLEKTARLNPDNYLQVLHQILGVDKE